ncbi:DnaB-like helicase C-terminal domain-containing protein [Streptomyces sp. NPDC032472]|uniref:DnaB-like helicase C-terminal domain-containing protein n=1 Tax=Streptomyces sp. NPDC032472 TaxID=3155018 RepID=UPI00340C5B57
MGRSTLLQNICQWNAGGTLGGRDEEGMVVPVLLPSAEQSAEQITVRALVTAGRVARDHVRTGELVEEDLRRLARARSILQVAPLFVLAPAVLGTGSWWSTPGAWCASTRSSWSGWTAWTPWDPVATTPLGAVSRRRDRSLHGLSHLGVRRPLRDRPLPTSARSASGSGPRPKSAHRRPRRTHRSNQPSLGRWDASYDPKTAASRRARGKT